MIQHCGSCKPGPAAEYQDDKYGKGNRVFNLMGKVEKTNQQIRCTVCAGAQYAKGGEAEKK